MSGVGKKLLTSGLRITSGLRTSGYLFLILFLLVPIGFDVFSLFFITNVFTPFNNFSFEIVITCLSIDLLFPTILVTFLYDKWAIPKGGWYVTLSVFSVYSVMGCLSYRVISRFSYPISINIGVASQFELLKYSMMATWIIVGVYLSLLLIGWFSGSIIPNIYLIKSRTFSVIPRMFILGCLFLTLTIILLGGQQKLFVKNTLSPIVTNKENPIVDHGPGTPILTQKGMKKIISQGTGVAPIVAPVIIGHTHHIMRVKGIPNEKIIEKNHILVVNTKNTPVVSQGSSIPIRVGAQGTPIVISSMQNPTNFFEWEAVELVVLVAYGIRSWRTVIAKDRRIALLIIEVTEKNINTDTSQCDKELKTYTSQCEELKQLACSTNISEISPPLVPADQLKDFIKKLTPIVEEEKIQKRNEIVRLLSR